MKHKVSHYAENLDSPAPAAAAAPQKPLPAATPVSAALHEVAAASGPTAVELLTCREQLALQKDHYLRLAADFENFRKRTQRESAQQSAAGKQALIHDLLPILDHLERALASDQAQATGPLHVGVALTLRQMHQLLQQHGVVPAEDKGCPFDPHRHEAVAVRNDPQQPDQAILDVIQRGYGCGDSVLRPARVVVNDWGHAAGAARAG